MFGLKYIIIWRFVFIWCILCVCCFCILLQIWFMFDSLFTLEGLSTCRVEYVEHKNVLNAFFSSYRQVFACDRKGTKLNIKSFAFIRYISSIVFIYWWHYYSFFFFFFLFFFFFFFCVVSMTFWMYYLHLLLDVY